MPNTNKANANGILFFTVLLKIVYKRQKKTLKAFNIEMEICFFFVNFGALKKRFEVTHNDDTLHIAQTSRSGLCPR